MYEMLREMEAPPKLIAWVSAPRFEGVEARDLFELAKDATWIAWMGAAAGMALRSLVEATARELDGRVARAGGHAETFAQALTLTRQALEHRAPSAKILAAAERVEEIGASPAVGYRATSPAWLVTELASATAYVARAAEATFAAEAAIASQRHANALHGSAIIGAGPSVMASTGSRALHLQLGALRRDAILKGAVFVPAALSEAAAHLVRVDAGAGATAEEEASLGLAESLVACLWGP